MHVNKVSFNSSMQVHELKLVCVWGGGGGGGRGHIVCHVTSQGEL